MNKVELNKLIDLLNDIKKIDSVIVLHQSIDDSDFMTSQYQAKKSKLIGQFIDELVTSNIQSEQSFFLIQQIIGKYYPYITQRVADYGEEIDQLSKAI